MKNFNFTKYSAIAFVISLAILIGACYINCIANDYLEKIDETDEFYLYLFDITGRLGLTFVGFVSASLLALIVSVINKIKTTH